MKVRHSHRQRDLGYLCEDIRRHLGRLADLINSDPHLTDLLEKCLKRLDCLDGLDIGTEHQLDEIQYILGEMQVGLLEMDSEYKVISTITNEIQDHLDWA